MTRTGWAMLVCGVLAGLALQAVAVTGMLFGAGSLAPLLFDHAPRTVASTGTVDATVVGTPGPSADAAGPDAPASGTPGPSPDAAGPEASAPNGAVDWPELVNLDGRAPIVRTAHFAVYAADATDPLLDGLARRWARELERLLVAGAARAGRELPHVPVQVVFARAYAARCPARGLAWADPDEPRIQVFVDATTPDVQVRAVLAHEIAHHLTLSDEFVGDGVLTEGLANWVADEPMLAWQGFDTWDDAVRTYRADGSYVAITDPLGQQPVAGEDCLDRRDRVYNARASFVGWMVREFGLDTVLAMPYREVPVATPAATPPAATPPAVPDGEGDAASDASPATERVPDYRAATGADLPELERRWLAEIEATR